MRPMERGMLTVGKATSCAEHILQWLIWTRLGSGELPDHLLIALPRYPPTPQNALKDGGFRRPSV